MEKESAASPVSSKETQPKTGVLTNFTIVYTNIEKKIAVGLIDSEEVIVELCHLCEGGHLLEVEGYTCPTCLDTGWWKRYEPEEVSERIRGWYETLKELMKEKRGQLRLPRV